MPWCSESSSPLHCPVSIPYHFVLLCVLEGSMCRHKGIGMNRPKKTKVEVPQFLKVALLLNGWALDVQEAPEEKRRKRSPRMMELSVQRRVIRACEKRTRFCQKQHDKAVLRSSKAVAGLDACMRMLQYLSSLPRQRYAAGRLRVKLELEQEMTDLPGWKELCGTAGRDMRQWTLWLTEACHDEKCEWVRWRTMMECLLPC